MSASNITRHITSETPRVMVVDGSKVARRLIEQVLVKDVPGVTVVSCETGEEAKAALQDGVIDLVTTALRLPDIDGLELAHYIREHAPQAYIPIIVVSGDAQERLVSRSFGDDVTDYFDKGLGCGALSAFIQGYVRPEAGGGEVLYVEDSRVVAVATRRMLEKNGMKVIHVISVEDALAHLETMKAQGRVPGPDIILTDVYLKGGLTGKDLLEKVRGADYSYAKGQLPILVMTGDDNPGNQSELLRMGANDLVQKPIEERLLITKLVFQLRVGRMLREKVATTAATE